MHVHVWHVWHVCMCMCVCSACPRGEHDAHLAAEAVGELCMDSAVQCVCSVCAVCVQCVCTLRLMPWKGCELSTWRTVSSGLSSSGSSPSQVEP